MHYNPVNRFDRDTIQTDIFDCTMVNDPTPYPDVSGLIKVHVTIRA